MKGKILIILCLFLVGCSHIHSRDIECVERWENGDENWCSKYNVYRQEIQWWWEID